MKSIFSLVVPIFIAMLPNATVAEEFSIEANMTITSDYVFRGVSQTGENPAVQAGLDVSGPMGTYLGLWGSNANYNPASAEFDYYLGISKDLTTDINVDLGFLRYEYPGAAVNNTSDIYLIGTWKILEIGYYHTISADWFAVNNASGTQYTYMATGYDFTDELSSFLSYGMTKVSGENNDTNDYSDLKIGIGFSIFDLNVELAHTSTEYDTKSSKPDKIADDRFILSFSKSF